MPKPMYVWSGSAWVSVASEVESLANYATVNYASTQPGSKLVVPTSVAVGSGSGSVDTNGAVTFSGASSVSLNGCFTSAYQNYKVLVTITSVANGNIECRLRASGSDDSVATYNHGVFQYNSSNSSGGFAANTSLNRWIVTQGSSSLSPVSISMDIFMPQETQRTSMSLLAQGSDGTNYNSYFGAGVKAATTSFDGITFIFSGGTTGTLRVYGYKN
jgi:hypothetical protein